MNINIPISVHPDLDVQGMGACHIQQQSEQPALVTIHPATGAVLEEMTANTRAILHTAQRQVDRELQQDFATAAAAVLPGISARH